MLTKEKIEELLKTPSPVFSKKDYLTGYDEVVSCGNLLRLTMHEFETEDYPEKERVRNFIYETIIFIISSGNEPTFNNSHNWGYSFLAQTLVLIKNKKDLWNMFSYSEKEKLEWMMKMFLLMWTFGCHMLNDFRTGVNLKGNYSKNAGPNYRFVNNMMIVWTSAFFRTEKSIHSGLHYGNKFIEDEADYDYIIEKLLEFNWLNAHSAWTTKGFIMEDGSVSNGVKELFSTKNSSRKLAYINKDGNINSAGSGFGCRYIYRYRDRFDNVLDATTFPHSLTYDIFSDCFSGGECKSIIHIEQEEDFSAHILDNTISPYEGLDGMMKEFNIPDDGMGRRSSLMHCDLDFILVASTLKTLKLLDFMHLDRLTVDIKRARVGMNDCLYKIRHGYNGYSMGNIENYNSPNEFEIWRELWEIENF